MLSCGTGKDLEVAKRAVEEFRGRVAAEQDDAIYNAADAAWKQAIDRETNHKFFARLRRKLGKYQKSTNTGFYINFTTGGTFANLNYATQCEKGDLEETFSWHVANGTAYLTSYQARSPLLLTD